MQASGPGDEEPDRVELVEPNLEMELLSAAPDLELVAQLLAEGWSDAAAAMQIGRSAKYLQRARKSNPAFVARIQELKEQRARQAAAGLGALLEGAVAAVARGLEARRTTDQLRAAALVFDRFRAFRSDSEAIELIADLRRQVQELRDVLDQQQQDKQPRSMK
jgi:hypothetical protein